MLNQLFLETLNKAKENIRTVLNHNKENNYKTEIGLSTNLDKWDLLTLKKYYRQFTDEIIDDKCVIENKMPSGEKFTRYVVKKAKQQGFKFTADFESYAAKAYDRKNIFYISTNPIDLLSPSDFATYTSCFKDNGIYAHGVPKWALMGGIAILYSLSDNNKKTSRAWLYFYNKFHGAMGYKKGFAIFRNYGSSFDETAMIDAIATSIGIKKYTSKNYSCGYSSHDTYIDSFTAIAEYNENFTPSFIHDEFFEELNIQKYICPLCGKKEYIHHHIACCGNIVKDALIGLRRAA
ncbi:MAG: hypothetical protein ACYDDE_00720 [bacterium]